MFSHSRVCLPPDTEVLLYGNQCTNRPSCTHSVSLLQTIHLWMIYSTNALVKLNTHLQSQSSSRLPDSSCNPDSWKENETWLLRTVPRGDCAKEQQQSIKHAVQRWTSAILLVCSFPSIYLKSLWVRGAKCLKCNSGMFWIYCMYVWFSYCTSYSNMMDLGLILLVIWLSGDLTPESTISFLLHDAKLSNWGRFRFSQIFSPLKGTPLWSLKCNTQH